MIVYSAVSSDVVTLQSQDVGAHVPHVVPHESVPAGIRGIMIATRYNRTKIMHSREMTSMT